MKISKNMHILLLKGGNGSEREVSLKTAEVCAKAIKHLGHNITEIDIADFDILNLTKIKPDLCFNALHGDCGEDGSIQGLLNLMKIPYTFRSISFSNCNE